MAESRVTPWKIGRPQDAFTIPLCIPADFCLKIENESLMVHKELLASVSPYFKCMLDSGMQEVEKGMVEVKDLKAQSVKTVISYIYGEEISFRWDDVMDYLDIVEAWQLPNLKDKLEEYIISNINTENCLNLAFAAQRYNTEKVMNKLINFFSRYFTNIVVNPNFLSLKFTELKILLTDGVVRNISCDVKLRTCINWTLANEKEREKHFMDLVQHVGLTRCSDQFMQLVSKIFLDMLKLYHSETDITYIRDTYISKIMCSHESSSRFRTVSEGQTMIAIGYTDLKDPQEREFLNFDFKRNIMEDLGTLPRIFHMTYPAQCWTPYGMFSGGSQYDESVLCALLDIPSMNYMRLPDFNIPLSHIPSCYTSATFVNGKIYVLGNRRSSVFEKYGQLDKLYCFDLEAYRWDTCMNIHVSELSYVCGIHTKLYVFNRYSGSLDVYDTDSKQLASQHKVPKGLISWGSAVTTVNQDIFIMGTSIEYLWCHTFLKYCTTKGQWTTLASPLTTSALYSASYVDGKLVLCGSYQSQIQIYDISRDEWQVSSLEMPLKTLVFTMAL